MAMAAVWLLAQGSRWLSQKIKSEYLNRVLVRATDAVSRAVMSVEQTYVKALKEARLGTSEAGSKITKSEADLARREALGAARRLLGPAGVSEVMSVLGLTLPVELDGWLGERIEASVSGLDHPFV